MLIRSRQEVKKRVTPNGNVSDAVGTLEKVAYISFAWRTHFFLYYWL